MYHPLLNRKEGDVHPLNIPESPSETFPNKAWYKVPTATTLMELSLIFLTWEGNG